MRKLATAKNDNCSVGAESTAHKKSKFYVTKVQKYVLQIKILNIKLNSKC